ncbi:cytochrome P460 family protein [Methylocapsa sp. D3K7]|uniref:cytochrome P460 family protein n=1 Tax=Methylocapsa sp. D3K7 TaxID=3041435 RepID=UPI00244E95B6|nr:cytochrome P460 family protein [Methylocapsa sp. D3K7]WGJ13122.1 cytochrome P460 family protein [Methylocapsa sp. D3K7]
MSPISTVSVLMSKNIPAVVTMGILLAGLSSMALATQDKYTVQVPSGLAFSEFRGYEAWQTVAVSQSGDLIEVILANPVMIDAYLAGVPNNGRNFPDGSKMAKIHWKTKKSTEAPAPTTVPDTLHDIDFMVKDSKRFPDTGAWGYAQFNYAAASDAFTPEGRGTNCGYTCHTIVKAKDYVFTAYGKR